MTGISLGDYIAANDVELYGEIDPGVNHLTVLVTTYNHEKFILQTLQSIQMQDIEEGFHILVFDDNSSDGTKQILLDFFYANPQKVCLLLSNENRLSRGLESTIFALEMIRAEYVAFCEGDDYWKSPNKLSSQLQFMRANKSWCSISHHEILLENYIDPGKSQLMNRELWQKESRVPGSELSGGNFLFTCSVMLRRDAIRDEVLRAINGRQPGDYILYSLATEVGDIGFLHGIYSVYRLHENNMWQSTTHESRLVKTQEAKWFLAGNLNSKSAAPFRNILIKEHLLKFNKLIIFKTGFKRFIQMLSINRTRKA